MNPLIETVYGNNFPSTAHFQRQDDYSPAPYSIAALGQQSSPLLSTRQTIILKQKEASHGSNSDILVQANSSMIESNEKTLYSTAGSMTRKEQLIFYGNGDDVFCANKVFIPPDQLEGAIQNDLENMKRFRPF